jgi:hypothetical protein
MAGVHPPELSPALIPSITAARDAQYDCDHHQATQSEERCLGLLVGGYTHQNAAQSDAEGHSYDQHVCHNTEVLENIPKPCKKQEGDEGHEYQEPHISLVPIVNGIANYGIPPS